MEVTNKFKGLDLIEYLEDYGQMFITLYKREGSRPSPRKRNAKKAKWLSEKALQIAVKRGGSKRQRRKGKIYPIECGVSKNSKKRSESLPQ